ncbi:MAG: hydantoinase/oxoprolinase family protein, partial [Rhodospirillales bacterium]|nr:hydantoinase/oxoprolinase family protein [Rhodospirillales bacterium]
VPADASVFSAWGMMMSDLRRDDVLTLLLDLTPENAAAIEGAFAGTEERARSRFAAEGIAASAVRLARLGKFRYQNQEHTTEVPLDAGPITADGVVVIEAAFHETYEREYTYRLDAPVEMVGLHVVATVDIGKLSMTTRQATGRALEDAQKGTRRVDYALEGVQEAAIYDGERLEPGMAFDGPAIVEDPGTTVVIHPGNRAEMDGYGNIRIHIRN